MVQQQQQSNPVAPQSITAPQRSFMGRMNKGKGMPFKASGAQKTQSETSAKKASGKAKAGGKKMTKPMRSMKSYKSVQSSVRRAMGYNG